VNASRSGDGSARVRRRRAANGLVVVAARIFLLTLGGGALLWAAFVFPIFWRESQIERIAPRLVDRELFKPELLNALLSTVDPNEPCRADARRSAAIVQLRVTEQTLAAGQRLMIDTELGALHDAVLRSLACSPADPFLWMVLAWDEAALNGYQPDQLTFLRLSYQLGPNEGWIAIRRNRLALTMYENLTPDLADAALSEFAHMVASGFYWEPLDIFTGPGWPLRDKLLARLKDVPLRRREAFANALYNKGYDIDVPGVARRDPRPWY
jgi:hypothetical protein